jgi:hypothetical protein
VKLGATILNRVVASEPVNLSPIIFTDQDIKRVILLEIMALNILQELRKPLPISTSEPYLSAPVGFVLLIA